MRQSVSHSRSLRLVKGPECQKKVSESLSHVKTSTIGTVTEVSIDNGCGLKIRMCQECELKLEEHLNGSEMPHKPSKLLEEVLHFVEKSSGLKSDSKGSGEVIIHQALDGKTFQFQPESLSEVLQRTDGDGKAFIQINFVNGHKVLFTDTLVGFKPRDTYGLDMAKIPRVVTTPDLVSVFEAIEEGLSSDQSSEYEIEVLKRVYSAILLGGEAAGFRLDFERRWLSRLMSTKLKASA